MADAWVMMVRDASNDAFWVSISADVAGETYEEVMRECDHRNRDDTYMRVGLRYFPCKESELTLFGCDPSEVVR